MIISIYPCFLFSLFSLFIVVITCKKIVISINIITLILKLLEYVNGLITAPIPINKHKFKIFEPDTIPNNISVLSFFAAIIPVIISGNAVPIATIVIPINFSVKPSLPAIKVELSTTKSAPNFSPSTPKNKINYTHNNRILSFCFNIFYHFIINIFIFQFLFFIYCIHNIQYCT